MRAIFTLGAGNTLIIKPDAGQVHTRPVDTNNGSENTKLMRPVVDWMTKSDDVILEWLDNHDIAVPPQVITFNVPSLTYSTTKRRLKELEGHGLVSRYDEPQGYVEITEAGRKYLSGELNAEDLQ